MRWEYKILRIESRLTTKKSLDLFDDELEKAGDEGWELVNFQSVGLEAIYLFIFKRPKDQ